MKYSHKLLNALMTLFVILVIVFLHVYIEYEPISPLPKLDEPACLYSNLTGDHLQKTCAFAIHNAKKSIVLLIYSLHDSEILQALRKKSEEGISVKVVYDAEASSGIDKKLGQKVQVIARSSHGHMHHKILVIDEEEVWLGSANMTTDSLCEQGNLMVGIKSKQFAQAVLEKASYMLAEGYEKPIIHKRFLIGRQNCELWFLPDNRNAIDKIISILREAKKTIRVAMFTFSHIGFAKELIAAKKRGVHVKVFLDHQSSRGASAKVVKLLKKNGIEVLTNPGKSMLHYKLLYVDEEVLVNGSANWTIAAFNQNDDFFMILNQLTTSQKNKMAELIQHLERSMKPLKLALFGNGKMGKLVAEAAKERGHTITSLQESDLAIDFSHAEAVAKNVAAASNLKKNIVIGTTGWEKDWQKVQEIADKASIGLLYSPNFSVGVHLFLKALQQAAKIIAAHGGYDVGGYEIHHNQKADSPSGTAIAITDALLENFTNKKSVLFEASHCPIPSDSLHFSSLRLGHNPGRHTVIFDSLFDTITLTHEAKGRKGFAAGAIIAAEWLQGKKGFYRLENVL